jgi:hypothetical protein
VPLDLYIFYQQIHWNETKNDPALERASPSQDCITHAFDRITISLIPI